MYLNHAMNVESRWSGDGGAPHLMIALDMSIPKVLLELF